jgi:hypothetical protein
MYRFKISSPPEVRGMPPTEKKRENGKERKTEMALKSILFF